LFIIHLINYLALTAMTIDLNLRIRWLYWRSAFLTVIKTALC